MIDSLKPYEKMKPSGPSWLGDVPEHWETRPLRGLIRQRSERGSSDLPLLSVARERGVFVRNVSDRSENHNVVPEDLSNYKVAKSSDLVINKMKAWQGSMGIAPCDGIVSPAYFVFEFGIGNPDYGAALLRSKTYVAEFARISDGVRIGQWDLDMVALRQLPVLVPPDDEQQAIIDFLKRTDSRISLAISAKRKTIGLLDEQKQAIVYQAVTRGLDPSAPVKPSGLPWLGDIPEHWNLTPNRALLRRRKVLVGEKHTDYQLLSLTKQGVIARDLTNMTGKFSADMGTSQEVRPGDLVFCLFDVPETPRTVGLSRFRGMITGAYTVLEPAGVANAGYLELFYRAMDDRKLLSPLYSGLRNTIPVQSFVGIKSPQPPSEEQHAIIHFVEAESRRIDRATSKLEREIRLLTEYRARLVSDVVTGKLDVREAAKSLPVLDQAPPELVDAPIGDVEDELELAETR